MDPIRKAILLLRELGPAQLADNLVYRLQLRSGWFEKTQPPGQKQYPSVTFDFSGLDLFSFSWANSTSSVSRYIALADEIVAGQFRPFGGEPAALVLSLPQPLKHWTKYGDTLGSKDIKQYWEPARFGWVFPLCAAYAGTGDEKYPAVFWQLFETFCINNPVNMGPNWTSAQEVALRLIPWVMAGQVFAGSKHSTAERLHDLSDAIWQHCRRIPPSLNYARSQFNNHWLSEALGLMIGGWLFSNTPEGKRWLQLGNKEFRRGILRMVDKEGTFSQHSNNYHRLLLHLALMYRQIASRANISVDKKSIERMAQATRWLAGQLDAKSGEVPNLGHNDGSNLLPFGDEGYNDYRPTLQAAGLAFFGTPLLPSGQWDELWKTLGLSGEQETVNSKNHYTSPAIHRIGDAKTWATLRACRFNSRPAHADLLHTDLWCNGVNIALDAGTYAYNLPEPWTNSLSGTHVHNTVTVAGQDQMVRAGKFLWLRRPNAEGIRQEGRLVSASVRFHSPIAYTQTRTLTFLPDSQFEVIDLVQLNSRNGSTVPLVIQWLMPDWDWKINGQTIELIAKGKSVRVEVSAGVNGQPITGAVTLIRAGETILGKAHDPIRGWVSQTYLQKSPALSFCVEFPIWGSLEIRSLWSLDWK